MAKGKGLLASLEDDIAAAGITQEELARFDDEDVNHQITGDDNGSAEEDDYEPDSKSARDRIAKRREGRSPLEDEGGSPSDTSGKSRGSDGSSSDTGKGTPQDGETLPSEDEELEPKKESDWARHRRELREAQAEINRLKNAPVVDKAAQPAATTEATSTPTQPSAAVAEAVKKRTLAELGTEPDRNEDLAGWLVWNAEKNSIMVEEMQAESKAERAKALVREVFVEMEQSDKAYEAIRPDYPQAIAHATKAYAQAVKVLMPGYTDAQIDQAIKKEKLALAFKCAQDGTRLQDVLYDIAIERFGYDPEAASTADNNPAPEVRRAATPPKPSLKVVEKNQRRSASPLEGGGRSGTPRITLEQASQMSPYELMSLPPEDIAYLEAQGF